MRAHNLCFAGPSLLLILAGCASSPAPRPPEPTQLFAGPARPASHYETDAPTGDALRGPHGVRAARGVTLAAEALNQHLATDPRLAEFASLAADALERDQRAPSYAVLDFWARSLGLVEPTPVLLSIQQGDSAQVEANVQSSAARLLQGQHSTHYGAVTREGPRGVLVVVAVSTRSVSLRPVPRQLAESTRVTLEGHLLEGTHDPVLVVSFPDGTSERMTAGKGTEISVEVPFRGTGEHRAELLADSPQGTTVVLNVPLFVGVSPPTSITVVAPRSEGVLAPDAVDTRLLALINDDRHHAGAPPLLLHAKLASVALAHSQDMDQHGFVAHASPTSGTAPDRVAKAGIRTPLVLENIGRGYEPEEIHGGLMESPGHRANVLNPDATHVGIGTVVQQGDGRIAYLVTEVFARMAKKIDLLEGREQLVELVNHERKRRGLAALVLDDTLTKLCARTAQQFFLAPPGSPNQPLVEALSREASDRHPPYTRLATLMTVVTAIDEAASLDALLDPHARGVGLGLAQGTRADTTENAISVVALVGY